MPWFKVDDGFHGHPKVIDLSVAAVGIWTLAGSWCAKYLTDGHVTTNALFRLGGNDALAAELVASGLWLVTDGGYQFKDWEDYQPLKVDVEAEREAARDRMRAVRANSKGVRPTKRRTNNDSSGEQQANDSGTSEEVRVAPSLPDPSDPVSSGDAKLKETRLPKSWAPTAEHFALAKSRGVDILAEVDAFRLHAETHDRHAARWNGAFTTWLKKSRPTARAAGPRKLMTVEELKAHRERVMNGA